MLPMTDHDPGDEDRSPDGPWCVRCGDALGAPERDCPNPAPGQPYVDCGRGGHMFSARKPPGFHLVVPGVMLVPSRSSACAHDWDWDFDDARPWRIGGRRCSRCNATGARDSLGRIVEGR